MLKHNLIIDRLSESQKIKLLTDVRVLASDEYTRLGIPFFKLSSVQGYADDLYPSPTAMANSWNMRVINEVASDIAARMSNENINAAVVSSPVAKLNIVDQALSEDPYLSSKVSGEYLSAIGNSGLGAVLDGAYFDESDVMMLDREPNEQLVNEFVIRALKDASANKKCDAIIAGADITVKNYENVNSYIADKISAEDGKAFGSSYVLCKNVAPEETVVRIVKGQICLDGSEAALKASIDRYKRLKLGISEGLVSVCELDAEIESGNAFPPEKIDEAVDRVLEFVFECAKENRGKVTSHSTSATLAKNAAYESTVLLKNKGKILPLKTGTSVAFVGDIVANYNGNGFDPNVENDLTYYIRALGCSPMGFYRGYDMREDRSEDLLNELNGALANVGTVVLFMGTNPQKEAQMIKTHNLCLPANQLAALAKIRGMGKKIIAIVSSDLSIDVTFDSMVDALVLAPLNIKQGVEAALDVIAGRTPPAGKLARTLYRETEKIEKKQAYYVDLPNAKVGTFLGYRYYDSANYDVAYPFGFGLHYSRLIYAGLSIQGGEVFFAVKNKGKTVVSETVQVYLGMKRSKRFRPRKQLVGFEKITLQPGASTTVRIPIVNTEMFDVVTKTWACEQGEYTVYIGPSVRDIRLTTRLSMGNTVLEPIGERVADYLQSETNIISERYTLEADYKLMKRNLRNIIFGAGSLFLAVTMFLFSLITGNVGIFFNAIAVILAIAGVVFFILEGSDRRKIHKEERARIDAANKASFQNAQGIPTFSTDRVFAEEFDRVGRDVQRSDDGMQVKVSNYLDHVTDALTFESATEQFIAFAASRGYKFEATTVKELFASMSASRLVITRGMSNDSFAAFIRVLSEYFGTPAGIDVVDRYYVNDNAALFKTYGNVKQKTAIANALELSVNAKERVCIAALTDVTFAEMSNYFVPFARYIRNPRSAVVIEAIGEYEQPVTFAPKENLWFFVNLRSGESLRHMPAYISELASVVRIEYTGSVPMMLSMPTTPFSYYQFDYMLEKIKDIYGIPEELWKRIDALENFVNNNSPFTVGNRASIAVERFFAAYSACGSEANEALDRALSARIIPSVIVALDTLENLDDKNLSEKLEMIFGEDNVEACRTMIRTAGSSVI